MVEMKKVWSRPLTVVQNFEANEYVAACGDENKVYKFKCDAVSGSWAGDGGSVYLETNGQEGFQLGGDTYRSQYYPCEEEHEAKVTDEFKLGYLVTLTGGVKKVIVWTGLNDDNTHCTTNLKMDTWETAKS